MIKPVFKDNCSTLVVNCSNEYVPVLDVCLQSILDNSNDDNNYDIVVLQSTISEINKNYLIDKYSKNNFSIRFFNPSSYIDINIIEDPMEGYSKESFYKIIIPRLFRNYEKVIYSDVDIIFECDISEINTINIEDFSIAATVDYALVCTSLEEDAKWFRDYLKNEIAIKHDFDYYAAGLYLINVKKFSDDDVKTMLENAYKTKFIMQEQDLINKYLNGKIYTLSYKYCINTAWFYKFYDDFFKTEEMLQDYKQALEFPKVYHYSGSIKPWHRFSNDPYEKIWWKYAEKTKYSKFFAHKAMVYDAERQKSIEDKIKNMEDKIKNMENKIQSIGNLINDLCPLSKYVKTMSRYYKYKIMSKILIGKKRKHYKNKYIDMKRRMHFDDRNQ